MYGLVRFLIAPGGMWYAAHGWTIWAVSSASVAVVQTVLSNDRLADLKASGVAEDFFEKDTAAQRCVAPSPRRR